MSLRDIAAQDSDFILSDVDGNTVEIRVTDPEGNSGVFRGWTTDVSTSIDPETGLSISGRNVSAALSMKALQDKGMDFPRNQPSQLKKPWLLEFADVNGISHIFKVTKGEPDRTLNRVDCKLELYRDARTTGPTI